MNMVVRKRPATSGSEGGGAKPPSSSGGGGIKKRTNLPPALPDALPISGEIGEIINAVNKEAGPSAPFILASQNKFHAGFIRTGILSLDLGLGGGWRLSSGGMLYGEKSAGKTTTALLTVAMMQRVYPDCVVVWVDIEGTLDLQWAKKLGVDLERLIVVLPDTGEDAVNHADAVIRAKEVAMVVTDSIAMLSPQKEIDSAAEDDLPGLQARLVTKFLRKTNNAIIVERKRRHYPLLLHLNQFRMKIMAFGDPRSLPGGKALEFSTTQQAEVKNKEHQATAGEYKNHVMFNEHTINITKNKSGGPIKEALFKFIRTPHLYGTKVGPDSEKGAKKEEDTKVFMPEGWIDQAATIQTLGLKSGVFTGVPQAYSFDNRKFRGAGDYTKWAIENYDQHLDIQGHIIDYYVKKWNLVSAER